MKRQKAQNKTKVRLLLLCVNNAGVARSLVNCVSGLEQVLELECFFICTGITAKLLMVKNGYTAVTLTELVHSDSLDSNQPYSDKILDEISSYDKHLNWNKVPVSAARVKRMCEGSDYYHEAAASCLDAFDHCIREFQPHSVFTWNGISLSQRALAYSASLHELPCFYLERGLLPEHLSCDVEGVNYLSVLSYLRKRDIQSLKISHEESQLAHEQLAAYSESQETIVKRGEHLTSIQIRKQLEIPQHHKIILLPLQIEWDSNIRLYSPRYKRMKKLIEEASPALSDEETTLIVKPHPEDKDRFREFQPLKKDHVRFVDSIALPSLLGVADVVLTINSTVGLEAALKGKRVLVVGKALYRLKGFTSELRPEHSLKEALQKALRATKLSERENEALLKFYIQLKKHYLWPEHSLSDPWAFNERLGRIIHDSCNLHEPVENPPQSSQFIRRMREECNGLQEDLKKVSFKCLVFGPEDTALMKALGEDKRARPVEYLNRRTIFRLPGFLIKNYDRIYYHSPLSLPARLLLKLLRGKRKVRLD